MNPAQSAVMPTNHTMLQAELSTTALQCKAISTCCHAENHTVLQAELSTTAMYGSGFGGKQHIVDKQGL